MNLPITSPVEVKTADPDIAKQAVPGHGVPSQDPESGAQVGLSLEEAERESKSALIGGGMVAGVAAGSAIGAVVAGPVGILVGTVGAIAGVVGSNAAGELVNPSSKAGTDDKAIGPEHTNGSAALTVRHPQENP